MNQEELNTELIRAFMDNRVLLVKALVGLGADIFVNVSADENMFENIISLHTNSHTDYDLFKFLVEKSIELNEFNKVASYNFFQKVCRKSTIKTNFKYVEYLVETMKKVMSEDEFKKIINTPNLTQFRPIHIAASNNNERLFELLIQNGVELPIEEPGNWNLLHMIAHNNSTKVLDYLLNNDIDNSKIFLEYAKEEDQANNTPIQLCNSVSNTYDKINELLKKIANASEKEDNESETDYIRVEEFNLESVKKWCEENGYVVGKKL